MSYVMNDFFRKLLKEDKIGLADVGASGGVEPRWAAVREFINCAFFEPDERSHESIQTMDGDKIFAAALGDAAGSGSFNLCRKPQVSSSYEPNFEFVNRFSDAQRWEIISREECNFSTLDQVISENEVDIDFIKLDVQGSEKSIIDGADNLLSGPLVGLEVEVEFVPLYINQPLFGDICKKLAEKGFEFFDFTNLCRWEREKFNLHGQCVFGDALFLRSPFDFAKLIKSLPADIAHQKARRYVVICALYDRADLIPVCMDAFSSFLDKDDMNLLSSIHKKLVQRRNKINILLKIADRILYYAGFRVTPLQWK